MWALRATEIPHVHVFSCDNDQAAQALIRSASPPGIFFSDMLTRAVAVLPQVDIYVCGFPCTPYSSLRSGKTKLFWEPNAKPYFAMLNVLRQKPSALAILENVGGLSCVMQKVLRDLERLRWYHVIRMVIDSEDLGEPVSRPRYYFLLWRRDACIVSDATQIADFSRRCLSEACSSVKDHITDRLLPRSDPEVQRFLRSQRRTNERAEGTKWKAKHAAIRSSRGVLEFRGATPMPLSSKRQREVWQLAQEAHMSSDIIVDVSQSIERAHVRTNGVCPTITPGGVICVGTAGRPVLPCEKLILHGFPLHRMKIPGNISDQALGKIGGNTMHLHSVGLAMLIGMSLLKDPVPPIPATCPPSSGEVAVLVEQPRRRGISVAAPSEAPSGKRRRLA